MSELEEKLGAILGNPQMMQQIMTLAQGLEPPSPAPDPPAEQGEKEGPDLAMLQKIAGILKNTGIDRQQRQLLQALGPYLSPQRLGKLEKAMRSAKLAQAASGFLENGGLSALTGR